MGGDDAELREICLRIGTEQQHSGQGDDAVFGDADQIIQLWKFQSCKMRPVLLPAQDILSQTILIQILNPDLLHRADIVPVLFAERLVAVHLIFCHRLIRVTNTDIGTLHSSPGGFKTRALCYVHRRNFGRDKNFAVFLVHSKDRPNHRGHLFAVFHDLALQVLCIIYANLRKIGFFIQAEHQDSTAVLIGKRRQGIIQLFRASTVGRLYLHRLFFTVAVLYLC